MQPATFITYFKVYKRALSYFRIALTFITTIIIITISRFGLISLHFISYLNMEVQSFSAYCMEGDGLII